MVSMAKMSDGHSGSFGQLSQRKTALRVAVGGNRPHNNGMSTDSPNILDAALNLSDQERANLAYRLLQTLKPPDHVSDGDAEFESELERRIDDYEAGKTVASDWDEAAARLQNKLKERDSS